MTIDTLTHLVCEFGNSMMNRTEIDDDQSVRSATGSNSAHFIKDAISPILGEKNKGFFLHYETRHSNTPCV